MASLSRPPLALFGLSVALASVLVACSDDDGATETGPSTGVGAVGPGGSGGAGPGGAGGFCENQLPTLTEPPATLSETGLYASIADHTVAPYAREYAPQFQLWSDGAVKTRWVYLPECEPIDTSDMDEWSFPVGTRIWKEFVVPAEISGGDDVLVETRLITRIGPGDDDFLFAAYVWNDDDTEAIHSPDGAVDAKGTTHNVPDELSCRRCHGAHPAEKGGWPSRFLSFSAIQLSDMDSPVNVVSLSDEGKLSDPVSEPFTVPGNEIEQQALGYLHANCSQCHNTSPDGLLFPTMSMKLSIEDNDVLATGTYTDLVNHVPGSGPCENYDYPYRVAGGSLEDSCLHARMMSLIPPTTGGDPGLTMMPPLAREVVDDTGVAAIEAWIEELPAP
jgi:hypothetical protein